jgi:hypothetical protein
MFDAIHRQVIELLLSSMYSKSTGDRRHSFLYHRPGSLNFGFGGLSATVWYKRKELVRSALYIRKCGPAYLSQMAVEDINKLLTDFISENFGYLSNETFAHAFDCSFNAYVSDSTKNLLADALAGSNLFQPKKRLTLYPLVPICIDEDFDSPPFFLIKPGSLGSQRLPQEMPPQYLMANQFPPVANWEGRKETPTAWLGVRSPTIQSSNKIKSMILGAVALTPHPRDRHMFSMRSMFGGWCALDDGVISLGDAHTPPLMEDIVISERDHAWLTTLSAKLESTQQDIKKELRALEYFFRAWPLDPSTRFPWLCMALDAIFGEASRATQAVIDAATEHTANPLRDQRLRDLLGGLRAAVIHGGAPDVYDSKKYQKYYDRYDADPIDDLELIVARCLRSVIFGEALQEHPRAMP